MAFSPHSLFTLFMISLHLILSLTPSTFAGRDIQSNSKMANHKQPESLVPFDGTVLIPGIGRVVVPKFRKGFNPFTYNPVTGTGGGTTGSTHAPSSGGGVGGSGGGPSYIPGGDDTFLPNPGFEVPVSGGPVPTPTRP